MSKIALHTHKMKATNDFINLFVLGDLHIGQQATDEKAIKEMVDYIAKRDPANTRVLLTGDLIENVLPTSKGDLFEMTYPNPSDQIKVVTDMLKPIKNRIIAMVDGNHENRTTKATGIDPSGIIADKLEVPYFGYRCAISLEIARKKKLQKYLIYMKHGSGSIPKKVGGRYNKLSDIQSQAVADIYVKGHIHHKLTFSSHVWKLEGGKMVKKKMMFVSNGSYLNDPEYAIRMGYQPSEPGVARLDLGTNKYNIHASM